MKNVKIGIIAFVAVLAVMFLIYSAWAGYEFSFGGVCGVIRADGGVEYFVEPSYTIFGVEVPKWTPLAVYTVNDVTLNPGDIIFAKPKLTLEAGSFQGILREVYYNFRHDFYVNGEYKHTFGLGYEPLASPQPVTNPADPIVGYGTTLPIGAPVEVNIAFRDNLNTGAGEGCDDWGDIASTVNARETVIDGVALRTWDPDRPPGYVKDYSDTVPPGPSNLRGSVVAYAFVMPVDEEMSDWSPATYRLELRFTVDRLRWEWQEHGTTREGWLWGEHNQQAPVDAQRAPLMWEVEWTIVKTEAEMTASLTGSSTH